jgi:hypothetical protein
MTEGTIATRAVRALRGRPRSRRSGSPRPSTRDTRRGRGARIRAAAVGKATPATEDARTEDDEVDEPVPVPAAKATSGQSSPEYDNGSCLHMTSNRNDGGAKRQPVLGRRGRPVSGCFFEQNAGVSLKIERRLGLCSPRLRTCRRWGEPPCPPIGPVTPAGGGSIFTNGRRLVRGAERGVDRRSKRGTSEVVKRPGPVP